ncbi:MAG: PLP-dependent aminotransferase family protein [Clostridia bacterium]|nr:PLP-dependent aminotransferase family protein [Clostridia bacterium]
MENSAFATRVQNLSGNVIREILKITDKPDIISFAGGMPSPDALPAEDIRQLSDEILRTSGKQVLQYSTTEGYGPLRQLIAASLAERGIHVGAEQVLVISGAQQGIDLSAKVFINPGDYVIVERPTYLAALHIFRSYEARFGFVDSDGDGMIPESLEAAVVRYRPKVIYVVPTFQNPTGVTLSLERRRAVAEIAARRRVAVVEDDPYAALRYDGMALPSIASFDKEGFVVFLGSFSKVISPGLRVGYAAAAPDVFRKLTIGKQATDVHTSNLSQRLVYEFCNRGKLVPHIDATRQGYRVKRDAMIRAIERHFPKGAKFTRPDGGLFIWVELPESIDTTLLLERATERKVAFIPGSPFYADGSGRNTMRLNFTNASIEAIDEGMHRLGSTIAEALGV